MSTMDRQLLCRHFQEKYLFSRLTTVLCNEIPRDREVIFLCIGIDRSTGDCFGPLTGTLLEQHRVPNVWGTLEKPVHAKNLAGIYDHLPEKKYVVAIDASLGSFRELGYLKVKKSPLLPGSATGKSLPSVGDISVVLIVNIAGLANYLLLQSSSLNLVWKGANVLARAIATALYIINKEQRL